MRIAFFDTTAATDELIVRNEGMIFNNYVKEEDDVKKKDFSVSAGIGFSLNLARYLNLGFGTHAKHENESESNTMNQTMVKNALLSDFLGLVKQKPSNMKRIRKFRKAQVEWVPGSLAYIQSVSPLLNMVRDGSSFDGLDSSVDIQKIENAFKNTKGYYEVLLRLKNDELVVLRLNNGGFWNNYKLMDLLNMEVEVIGQYVGEKSIEELSLEGSINRASSERDKSISSVLKIELEKNVESNNSLKMYDAVLMGTNIL